jgi:hypothetical protein
MHYFHDQWRRQEAISERHDCHALTVLFARAIRIEANEVLNRLGVDPGAVDNDLDALLVQGAMAEAWTLSQLRRVQKLMSTANDLLLEALQVIQAKRPLKGADD